MMYFLILIYQIQFKFFLYGVHIFFGLWGIWIAYSRGFLKYDKLKFLHSYRNPLSLLAFYMPCLCVSFFSMAINHTNDAHFFMSGVNMFFSYFAFFLLAYLFVSVHGVIKTQTVVEYFIISQILYLLISIIFYFYPNIYDSLIPYLRVDESAIDTAQYANLRVKRLQGPGVHFFTSGALSGMVLILISFYLCYYKCKVYIVLNLLICFLLIFIFGMMSARTTIIGAVIAFIILIHHILHRSNKGSRVMVPLFVLILLLFVGSTVVFSFFQSDLMENLFMFGFEAFLNYENSGTFEVGSNENLYSYYSIIPDNIKTWIIGDAMWKGKDGYYMGTDIGYSRNIFYFGIIGLFFYLLFHFVFLRKIFIRKSFKSPFVMYSLFIYMLLLNLKGVIDFYSTLLIFLYCDDMKIGNKNSDEVYLREPAVNEL